MNAPAQRVHDREPLQADPWTPPDRAAAVEASAFVERYADFDYDAFERRRIDVVLRTLDLAIAGGCLLVLLPALAPIALAVRLTSGSPVLYRGRRVGRGGRVYTMFKFRTLKPDAETRLGPYYGDELLRLTEAETTRFGRVLRASQLDEVPQLWNVIKGEMSIVGPRPVRPAYFEELRHQIPQYWQRFVVRPGVTGFAQMRVMRDITWGEKLAHDLEYIADRSVRLYLRVVLETAWRLLTRPVRAVSGRVLPRPG